MSLMKEKLKKNDVLILYGYTDTVIMAIFAIWRKIQKEGGSKALLLKDMLAKNENIRLYRNGLILSTLGEFSPSNIGPPLSTLEKEKKVAAATARRR